MIKKYIIPKLEQCAHCAYDKPKYIQSIIHKGKVKVACPCCGISTQYESKLNATHTWNRRDL